MLAVIGGGLITIVALATLIGLALDRQARDAAWKHIATSRRINTERARELEELAVVLDAREYDLDLRERRLDVREDIMLRRETPL